MRIKLSVILLFVLSCFQAQEIVDKNAFKKCLKENSRRICLSDKDKDGVPFYLDICSEVPGLPEFNGCPDTDGDGIPDKDDRCADVSGPSENQGCPWPDSDGDGIRDIDDACPNNIGPTENHGCPWPDTDGDGVLDKDDACPTVPGSAKYNGCYQKDCDKEIIEEKERISKFKEDSKNVDYNKLTDEILKSIDKKSIDNDNLLVSTQFVLYIEAGGCSFIKNQSPMYNNSNIWSLEALKKISVLLNKNIIIAGTSQSVHSSKMGLEGVYGYGLKKIVNVNYHDQKIALQAIKYFKEIPKDLKNYGMLMISFKNELGNIVKTEISYFMIKNASPINVKTYNITYQYVNDNWNIIEKG